MKQNNLINKYGYEISKQEIDMSLKRRLGRLKLMKTKSKIKTRTRNKGKHRFRRK